MACARCRPAAPPTLDAKAGEWPSYGANSRNTKYSPLDQINPANVKSLKVAWAWDSPDLALIEQNSNLYTLGYEATPLMIGGVLYVSTSLSEVAAIDARTGKTIWVYDPETYKSPHPTNLGFVHRGVAYWTDGKSERIFIGTADAYLVAIDAKTGHAVDDFGNHGRVNLTAAIPYAVNARNYAVTSPPLVCRDVVIVGSSIDDVPKKKEAPRGDIQAFDVHTGKPAWIFHTVAQEGEFGNDTWENGSWKYTGAANPWTIMSYDDELGYAYISTGTPTNDWYGGDRLGKGLFGECLICLDAKSGKRIWHFQSIHHGLWDYDLPAAPVLCDIKVDGKQIKAVAQITKTGFCFVFDRVTGKPVWPIEERPVPQSSVPGEHTSATQPFPTKPAPFELQGSTEDNLINFTPELHQEALAILNKFEHGPIFTPPSEKGTINMPGWGGGANWWGAAFDPDTGMFYIPSITSHIVAQLVKADAEVSNFVYMRNFNAGTMGPRGLPLFKPPYGRITAINLNTGDTEWMVPNGDGPRQKVNQIIGNGTDVGPLGAGGGGPLLTKTLLFVGQGAGGRGGAGGGGGDVMRAFDKKTGKVIAEIDLPATPHGTPMTYMVNGKQFIVVATADNRLVALALP
ncbi:MAG TPA: pyrroloquinoline quinone-dependent dehydrogenase [Blastocatellia bacterium]